MSESHEIGDAIGEHWLLIVGALTAIVAIIGALKAGRALVRSEINEGILISLDNGAGKRVEQIVRTAVHDALGNHPMRDRIEAHHDRIVELERAVLSIVTKTKD